MNIICGGNAEGKTNLLEAIYLLSTGRSFRSNNLSDLIKDDASYFYLDDLLSAKDMFSKAKKINTSITPTRSVFANEIITHI